MNRNVATRTLRRIGDLTVGRRRLAKALFWAAGKTARIKTYSRYYTLDSINLDAPEGEPIIKSSPSGRHWTPCRFSSWLLGESMQLDWDHWDHWACVHEDCEADRCPACGGIACDPEFEDEDD